MEDEITEIKEEDIKENHPELLKVHKWEHLAIRPSTFIIFREFKEISHDKSDNEFMLKLLEAYRLSLLKEKGELK